MRRLAAAILIALVWATVAAFPAGATDAPSGRRPVQGTWHRLNPDESNPAPEHERLRCFRDDGWRCVYDKVAEPELNLHWDATVGVFRGRDVTRSWVCPEWFPRHVCDDLAQVVRGRAEVLLADGTTLSLRQELVVTDGRGPPVLRTHLPEFGLLCPWYRTFGKAVRVARKADPLFRLPFDGVHRPPFDCATAA
jgi:hypothetical protein